MVIVDRFNPFSNKSSIFTVFVPTSSHPPEGAPSISVFDTMLSSSTVTAPNLVVVNFGNSASWALGLRVRSSRGGKPASISVVEHPPSSWHLVLAGASYECVMTVVLITRLILASVERVSRLL